jgi:hypothetical protein
MEKIFKIPNSTEENTIRHYSTLKDILWWITFRDGLPVMSDLESTGFY